MLSVSDVIKLMEPLKRKVELMVVRAIINSIQYKGGIQTAQLSVLADETMEGVEHLSQFGFSSNPPVGTSALVVCVAGERNHMVIIGTDNPQFKPQVETGESILYNQFGVKLLLNKDGELEITAPSKVIVTAPDVEIDGDLKVTGNIDADGDIIAQGDIDDADHTLANVVVHAESHVHSGVQTGAGNTGTATTTVP